MQKQSQYLYRCSFWETIFAAFIFDINNYLVSLYFITCGYSILVPDNFIIMLVNILLFQHCFTNYVTYIVLINYYYAGIIGSA